MVARRHLCMFGGVPCKITSCFTNCYLYYYGNKQLVSNCFCELYNCCCNISWARIMNSPPSH